MRIIVWLIVRFWRDLSPHSWRGLPTPSGDSVVRVGGPRPDRILLLGGGIAVGYGALTHRLALGGQLAAVISALTGRGAIVETLAKPDFELSGARSELDARDLALTDAIITTYGGGESASLLPVRGWRADLDALLDSVSAAAPRTHTFVVAIPAVAGIPGVWGILARRRALRFNEQSRQSCAIRERATFVQFATLDLRVQEMMNSKTYAEWATAIGVQIASELDVIAGTPRLSAAVHEDARQAALEQLGLRANSPDDELEKLVKTARDLFHVSGASVNLIDRDSQWTRAGADTSAPPLPRTDSICDYTIRDAELFVVEDTLLDARFADKPWATGRQPIRFYAGYPLEAPDGQRIGTLCIADTAPRSFSLREARLLQELAARAQALLWTSAARLTPSPT